MLQSQDRKYHKQLKSRLSNKPRGFYQHACLHRQAQLASASTWRTAKTWPHTTRGHEHCTIAQLLPEPPGAALHKGGTHTHQHRHSLQCSLFLTRTVFSQCWSYPVLPRVLQGKHSPHFLCVAEEGPGTGMGLFSTGEGCKLLLSSETFVTALICLDKLGNLSFVSVSPPVKFMFLPERSTVLNLSITSENKISR